MQVEHFPVSLKLATYAAGGAEFSLSYGVIPHDPYQSENVPESRPGGRDRPSGSAKISSLVTHRFGSKRWRFWQWCL